MVQYEGVTLRSSHCFRSDSHESDVLKRFRHTGLLKVVPTGTERTGYSDKSS